MILYMVLARLSFSLATKSMKAIDSDQDFVVGIDIKREVFRDAEPELTLVVG